MTIALETNYACMMLHMCTDYHMQSTNMSSHTFCMKVLCNRFLGYMKSITSWESLGFHNETMLIDQTAPAASLKSFSLAHTIGKRIYIQRISINFWLKTTLFIGCQMLSGARGWYELYQEVQ